MKAHQKDLLRYLSNSDTQYIIPVYQRNYSWKIAHCEKLVNDILNFMSLKSKGEQTEQYFMGSIVAKYNELSTSDVSEYLIIDGQQRITTISLILLALYHLLDKGVICSTNDKLEERIHDSYLVNRFSQNETKRLKLKPIEKDNMVFEMLFKNPDNLANSTSTIANNFRWIKKYLEAQLTSRELVDNFFNALQKLFIVSIELESSDDPQLIFESLNNSGKKLDESDLIRNAVLMNHSPNYQERLFRNYWQVIEENTYNKSNEKDETTQFIRYFLIYKLRSPIKEDEIYLNFKKYLNKSNDIESFLEELLRFSEYYKYLLSNKAPDNEISVCIANINRLNITVCYSLIFEILEQFYASRQITKEETILLLELLESYLLRRSIVNLPTHGLNKIFPLILARISKNNNLPLPVFIQEQFLSLKDNYRFPKNIEFKSSLESRELYKIKNVGRYILERIELFKNKERIEITKELSIEHVMPKTLSKQWKEDLGENFEEIHARYLNTLGNLTFTAYNSTYSNKGFKEKLSIPDGFAQSPIWLNQSIKEHSVWNEMAIKKRSTLLIDRAIEIWKDLPRTKEVESQRIDYFNLDSEPEEVTNTKPYQFSLFEKTEAIGTWKELYLNVFRILYQKDDLKLKEEAVGKFLFTNKSDLRSPKEIDQTSMYVETNLSAQAIFKNLKELIYSFTEEDDDFRIWYH
jgi:uncharacterized protein with ParB-like and HNH nuclease domain